MRLNLTRVMPALCIICFFYSCQSTLVVPIKNIKVQLVFLGDSFTDGIGTTGTNSSTSVPRVHGNMSFPLQTVRDLNDTAIFKPVIRGYPGQTAIGYINQQLQADLALFYPKDYDEIICVIEFGANDLTSYVNTSVTDFAKNIVTLHGLVKAISPKIKTIVMPVAPRLDMAFNNDFNTKRNEYNNWISNNYKTFANAYGDYTNYQQVYADHADNCSYFFNYLDVDHLTGVHPTDRGAAVIAEMAVQSIVATAGINLPEQPAITVPADNQQRLLFKGLLTENPPGTYTGFGYGVSSASLASGKDGIIQADYLYNLLTENTAVIAFDNNNVLNNYDSPWLYQVYPYNGTYYYAYRQGVGTSSGIAALPGDKYRLRRTANMVFAEKSSNYGQSWSLIYAFAQACTGVLYGKISQPNAANDILNPREQGFF